MSGSSVGAPADTPWVHRDKRRRLGVEGDLSAFEHEALQLVDDGLIDGEQLLGDHRQHLNVDAVELVEAGPRAAHGQALEKLAHHDVVHTLLAVEDDALLGHRLGQILGRFRLAGAGRARRRAPERHPQGASEREVNAVGQRRHHQPHRVAEVLAPVAELVLDLHQVGVFAAAVRRPQRELLALEPVVPGPCPYTYAYACMHAHTRTHANIIPVDMCIYQTCVCIHVCAS